MEQETLWETTKEVIATALMSFGCYFLVLWLITGVMPGQPSFKSCETHIVKAIVLLRDNGVLTLNHEEMDKINGTK